MLNQNKPITETDKVAADLKFAHDAYCVSLLTVTIDKRVAQENLQMSIDVLEKCLRIMNVYVEQLKRRQE